MKKIFITACISLLLVSCTPPKTIEITQEYFDAQYTQEDRSINLEDKNIKGFISLNEFKSDIEINNIYLSNNKIDIINVSDFDKLGKLSIANNNIRFITDLDLPDKIRHLDISNNKINSLEGLEVYTQMKTLNISNNNLTDEDLKNISKFQKLIFLKIDGNNFSPEVVNKINILNSRFLTVNQDPFEKNTLN